jgi:hypothetical protein
MADESRPNSTRNELLVGIGCVLLALVQSASGRHN